MTPPGPVSEIPHQPSRRLLVTGAQGDLRLRNRTQAGPSLLRATEELPPKLLAYMEKHDPTYLEAPREVSMERHSFFDEFRKHVDAKRQGKRD